MVRSLVSKCLVVLGGPTIKPPVPGCAQAGFVGWRQPVIKTIVICFEILPGSASPKKDKDNLLLWVRLDLGQKSEGFSWKIIPK